MPRRKLARDNTFLSRSHRFCRFFSAVLAIIVFFLSPMPEFFVTFANRRAVVVPIGFPCALAVSANCFVSCPNRVLWPPCQNHRYSVICYSAVIAHPVCAVRSAVFVTCSRALPSVDCFRPSRRVVYRRSPVNLLHPIIVVSSRYQFRRHQVLHRI